MGSPPAAELLFELKHSCAWQRRSLGLAKFYHGVPHGDIHLEARVAGAYRILGRGQLRGDTYHLRLERTGARFAALCSTDGVHWLSCGQLVLPAADPLLVGVAALQGLVVHFHYVQVLSRGKAGLDLR
jgi:hypothetical protein